MSDDLVTWLRTQLDRHDELVRDEIAADLGSDTGTWVFFIRDDLVAKRRILELHTPEVRNVEWWDASDDTGAAPVCRTCAVADPIEWSLPAGQAGVKPDGWLSGYVLGPCLTLRLVALPYAGEPGYREEWRP